jgi:hypothetical protein
VRSTQYCRSSARWKALWSTATHPRAVSPTRPVLEDLIPSPRGSYLRPAGPSARTGLMRPARRIRGTKVKPSCVGYESIRQSPGPPAAAGRATRTGRSTSGARNDTETTKKPPHTAKVEVGLAKPLNFIIAAIPKEPFQNRGQTKLNKT